MWVVAMVLVGVAVLLETAEQTCFRGASGRGSEGGSKAWRAVMMAGGIGLNLIGMGALIAAMRHVPVGVVAPLLATTNVTVALAGAALFGEKLTRRRWAGILLITAGVALVSVSFHD